MSDPVTNVEIEDVLSSIRRLVSDGDKARTRDSAPDAVAAETAQDAPESSADGAESKPGKFVLTPAFMVVGNNGESEQDVDTPRDAVEDSVVGNDDDNVWVEEIADDPQTHHDAPKHDAISADQTEDHTNETEEGSAPVDENTFDGDSDGDSDGADLQDMVWGSVDEARKAGIAAVPNGSDFIEDADDETEVHTSDRTGLIASIAELEAAVSNDVDDFEPDGSETSGEVMGDAIAWPGSVARNFEDAQDAEESEPVMDVSEDTAPKETPKETAEAAAVDDVAVPFEHRTADSPNEGTADVGDDQDHYGDDDLDGLPDVDGVPLDEDALRALVAEVVREELTGPLGERITRNVRKLVRREIYRILSSQEFD